jgi:hypothetical protein
MPGVWRPPWSPAWVNCTNGSDSRLCGIRPPPRQGPPGENGQNERYLRPTILPGGWPRARGDLWVAMLNCPASGRRWSFPRRFLHRWHRQRKVALILAAVETVVEMHVVVAADSQIARHVAMQMTARKIHAAHVRTARENPGQSRAWASLASSRHRTPHNRSPLCNPGRG